MTEGRGPRTEQIQKIKIKAKLETGWLFVAAAAALAEWPTTATTREANANFVAEKVFRWQKSANRATKLAVKEGLSAE